MAAFLFIYSTTNFSDICMHKIECKRAIKLDSTTPAVRAANTVQLRPPHNVQMESDRKPSYNLTWQLPNVSHYLNGWLEYEVCYKKPDDPDKASTILPIKHDQQWVEIETLSPGTVYEAAVRVKVKDHLGNTSIWSHWSTMEQVCMDEGVNGHKLQKVLRIDLPDPAEFFPSLTVVHGGDAQKWLSSPLSMDSFHIAVASPDVSVLEVLQKGNQEPCLLLPKEYLTPVDALETSGHSLSSCFVNRGYFFFHHQSLEIEPCKVYFTYDPFAQEDSGSEDGDSYQALHTTGNHPPLPSHSLMGSQEGVSLQREMKEPTQKVHQTISPTSMGRSPPAPAMEQGETQKDSDGIFPVCISPHRSAIGVPGVHEQPSSNANGMEVITDVATHASSLIGGNTPSFLQPIILNPGKASDLCRTASSSQVPNSEAYLSLRELQSQYNHQSV
uniref:interleukin-2 receptor subunit beta n=1 Tax=Euleptes europaea TaxID=460621 RepID=UPI0025401CAB|nr:interleukin-2 receptor subunit beta [Euleptes europaea]